MITCPRQDKFSRHQSRSDAISRLAFIIICNLYTLQRMDLAITEYEQQKIRARYYVHETETSSPSR
jgi:hypothetical protein